jgi:hypothetical protein
VGDHLAEEGQYFAICPLRIVELPHRLTSANLGISRSRRCLRSARERGSVAAAAARHRRGRQLRRRFAGRLARKSISRISGDGCGGSCLRKTVCIVARRAPVPHAVASKGDRDTENLSKRTWLQRRRYGATLPLNPVGIRVGTIVSQATRGSEPP